MITKSKILQSIAVVIGLFIAGAAAIHADEHAGKDAENKANPTASYFNWGGQMSPAMQNSMKPEVQKKMMGWMARPQDMMTMEGCAACHEGENLARIAKDWGPMLSSMKPMVDMMNPMTGMVEPMMNPMISMMHPMADMMGPMMNMMGPMMAPMTGMMNPMMGMMTPMMAPMTGMMNPMMAGMANPALMMNPGWYMSMMGPMMGMMYPMMNPMGMMGGYGGYGGNSMGQMMDPKQYENWFNQWTESMQNMAPQTKQ